MQVLDLNQCLRIMGPVRNRSYNLQRMAEDARLELAQA